MTQFANKTIKSSFSSVLFFQVLFTLVTLVFLQKKHEFSIKKTTQNGTVGELFEISLPIIAIKNCQNQNY